MRRKKKRGIAFVVMLAMILNVIQPITTFAAANDISGHWAEGVIVSWQSKGYISGYEDGSFKPDKSITRAEFVRLINKAVGSSVYGSVNFSDVHQGDWYYSDVALAMGKGYANGYGDGTFHPNDPVTRAQAASFISNVKGLTKDASSAWVMTDQSVFPQWAVGFIGATIKAGYMSGYPDGSFKANQELTRAEAVSVLDRIQQAPAAPVQQGNSTTSTTTKADYTIKRSGEKLSDKTVTGNLIIDEAVGSGSVYLEDVKVKGDIVVRGGGSNSIHGKDITVDGSIIMDKSGARFVLEDDSDVSKVKFLEPGTLEGKNYKDTMYDITIDKNVGTSKSVSIYVPTQYITLSGETNLKVYKDIDEIRVDSDAKDSTIYISSSANVDRLIADARIKITGSGDIDTLEANATGIHSTIRPDTVKVGDNGKKPTYDNSSNNDDDDSSSSSSRISVTPSSVTLMPGATQKLTVTPNRSVTWSSSNTGVATVSNGVVTAVAPGNATITAKASSSRSDTCNVTVISGDGKLTITQAGTTISGGTYKEATIDKNVGNGEVTLTNTTIQGNLTVNGGGSNSVILNNSKVLGTIILNKDTAAAGNQPPNLKMQGTSSAAKIDVQKEAIIETGSGTAAANVSIPEVNAAAKLTVKNAKISTLNTSAPVELNGAAITDLNAKTGSATITATSGKIENLVTEANVTLKGNAAVTAITIPSTTTATPRIIMAESGSQKPVVDALHVITDKGASLSGTGVVKEIAASSETASKNIVIPDTVTKAENSSEKPVIATSLYIKEVPALTGVTVDYGTAIASVTANLPKVVENVTLTNDTKQNLTVSAWTCANYNPNVADDYTFKGTWGALGEVKDGGLKPSVIVTVKPQPTAAVTFDLSAQPTATLIVKNSAGTLLTYDEKQTNNYIYNLPAGTYTYSASLAGYQTKTDTITLTSENLNAQTIKIALEKAASTITNIAAGALSSAGATTVTVTGTDLPNNIMVGAFAGSETTTSIKGETTGSTTSQSVILTLPKNSGTSAVTYAIKASLDKGTTWDSHTTTVSVPAGGGGDTPSGEGYAIDIKMDPVSLTGAEVVALVGSTEVNKAKKDDLVYVKITEPTGYEVKSVYYTLKNSRDKIDIIDTVQNGYSFRMPDNAIDITVEFQTKVTHAINVDAPDGLITLNRNTAVKGTEIVVTVSGEEKLTSLTINYVDDKNATQKIDPKKQTNTEYRFTMVDYDVNIVGTFEGYYEIKLLGSSTEANIERMSPKGKYAKTEATVSFKVIPPLGDTESAIEVGQVEKGGTTFLADTKVDLKAGENEHEYQFTMPSMKLKSNNVGILLTFTDKKESYDVKVNEELPKGSVIVENTGAKAAAGSPVTLTITPPEGQKLKEGSLTASYKDAMGLVRTIKNFEKVNNPDKLQYTFTMPAANVTVSAEFEEDKVEPTSYNVTIPELTNGKVAAYSDADFKTALAGNKANKDATVYLKVEPDKDYKLKDGSLKGVYGTDKKPLTITAVSGMTGGYQFTMPTDNVTISAEFIASTIPEPKEYKLTADNLANTTVKVKVGGGGEKELNASSSITAAENAEITLTISVPDSAKEIASVKYTSGSETKEATKDDKTGTYSFTMPAADTAISVVLKDKEAAEAKITGITANPTALPADESLTSKITVKGTNLPTDIVVGAFDGDAAEPAFKATCSGSGNTYTADLKFTQADADKTYTIKAAFRTTGDENLTWSDKTATVTVTAKEAEPEPPAVTNVEAKAAGEANKYTVTVKGTDLPETLSVAAFKGDRNTAENITFSKSGTDTTTEKVFTGTFPENATENDIAYTIKISLDKGTTYLTETNSQTTVNIPKAAPTTYNITLSDGSAQYITTDKDSAKAGETVTIKKAEKGDYELDKLDISITSPANLTITDNTFKMPTENVTITAVPKSGGATESHAITIAEGLNITATIGTSDASVKQATKDTTVTLTLKDVVSESSTLKVKATEGNTDIEVTVDSKNSKVYTFTMPDYAVTVSIKSSSAAPEDTPAPAALRSSAPVQTPKPTQSTSTPSTTKTTAPSTTKKSSTSSSTTKTTTAAPKATAPSTYTISLPRSVEGGIISISPSATSAKPGDKITITAIASNNYRFRAVTVTENGGTRVVGTANGTTTNKMYTCTFTMPSYNVNINAVFEPIVYTITPVVTPAGSGTINVQKTAKENELVNFSIAGTKPLKSLSISYVDAAGLKKTISPRHMGNGMYSFQMKAFNVQINAGF